MNRRKFIYSSALGLMVPAAFGMPPAQQLVTVLTRRKSAPVVSSQSSNDYVFSENFETAGMPSGWSVLTSTATLNWDDTESPLEGSQSLSITAEISTQSQVAYTLSASYAEIFVYFLLKIPTAFSNLKEILRLRDSGSTDLYGILIAGTNQMRVKQGSNYSNDYTVDALDVSKTYHVWGYYNNTGTGKLAFRDTAISAIEPTSGNTYVQLTNGTATGLVNKIVIGWDGNATGKLVIDKLRFKVASIGDNPS